MNRILLACIKYLGKCPCPICLVEKHQVPNLGTKIDMKIHMEQKRNDTDHRRDTIDLVRKWIFELGMNVGSIHIDRVLGPHSLVPTRVCP